MANTLYFGYCPGDSILHSAETRSKLLLALLFIFMIGTGSGLTLFLIAILCHFGMLISRISILNSWKRLASLKIFLLVLGGAPLFLTPGTSVQFFNEFSLPITEEGLECSIFTVSRLVCMVWISMILVSTTSPVSFIGVVSRFSSHRKVLQEFVLVGVLAFQIFPYLLAEAEEKVVKSWAHQSKTRNRANRLETAKKIVHSFIIWTVDVLAKPDRFTGRNRNS